MTDPLNWIVVDDDLLDDQDDDDLTAAEQDWADDPAGLA